MSDRIPKKENRTASGARTLLVTGASSATGRALIRRVAYGYNTVFAHYNHGAEAIRELRDAVAEDVGSHEGAKHVPEIIPVQADFADEQSTRACIDAVLATGKQPCHIVHLSAERAGWKKFAQFTWPDYQNGIDVSLRTAVLLAQAFVPAMAKAKYGRVVFMLTAFLCGTEPKYMSPYITAKHALYGLMQNLAAEYREKQVCFNAVSPEMIDTPFVEQVPEPARRLAAEQSRTGTLLSPEDVVPAIAYLLSEEADAVTGENIYVGSSGEWKKIKHAV